ncbi:MAG: TonB-dependent receptor, partial [Acidobacteria bacterium]|nr:TonB-dependent receptor [Acidobacteriota bacterium]
MKKILAVRAALCVALMALALHGFSQVLTGNITTRAQDSTGAVIPGVEVTISSPAMIGGSRKEITDETGSYRFTLLPPGTYRVTFALPGFKTLNIDGVLVTGGATQTTVGTLEVAATAEEITVTSTAPTIDLESATVGVNISQMMLDELPWSRSLTGMSMMIPGVFSTSFDIGNSNFGTSSTIAARSGGRGGGNVVTIDGLIWCQTYSDYGSFSEMNVSTNAKGADQMNSGITVAMVAKAGGNDFHGNFTAKYQNGSMQSNNITPDLIARGYPVGSNKYTHFTDFYGDIGGPILKDRLWFYGAWRQGYQGTFIPGFRTAVGGELTEFYTELNSPTAKLTYQLSSKQKLEAYVAVPKKWQPYRGASALTTKVSTQNQESWSAQGPIFTYTNILDSKTSITAKLARGGYWWPAYTYGFNDAIAGLGSKIFVNGRIERIPTVDWVGVKNVGVRISDNTTGATDGGFQSNYARPIRWQWNFDVSRFANLFGRNHEFKFGYMGWWDKDYSINFGYPYYQSYSYRSTSTETCPNSEICDNYFLHPYRVTVSDTPNNNADLSTYKSAHFNDKITLSRRLTLNVGLRWDHTASFLPPQGNDGSGPWAVRFAITEKQNFITNPDGTKASFPSYNLIEPRVSVAYDVTGSGSIAVKASYGRYGNLTSSPGSTLGPGAGGASPFGTTSCTYNNWDGTIPWDARAKGFGRDGIMGTADDINLNSSCLQVGLTAAGVIAPVRTYRFADNLDPSFLDEYTAGIEIGLSRNYSIRFNVSRKFDVPGTRTINNNLPYEAYSALTFADDPGRDGRLGTADDNPFGRIYYYS